MKKIALTFSKSSLLALEILAVLAVIFLLATGFVIWRLNTGTLDISFARGTVQQIFAEQTEYDLEMDAILLTWPDLKSPLTLQLEGARLIEANNTVLSIERLDVGVASLPLLAGELTFTHVTLAGPNLRLIRSKDNNVSLLLNAGGVEEDAAAASTDASGEKMTLQAVFERLANPEALAEGRLRMISDLHRLQIERAGMTIEDHVLGITWFVSDVDFEAVRKSDGLRIAVAADLPGGRNKASRIDASGFYDYNEKTFRAGIHLQDFDPRMIGRKVPSLAWLNQQKLFIEGQVDLMLNEAWGLESFEAEMGTKAAYLYVPSLYDDPVLLDHGAVKTTYDADERYIILEQADFYTQDITFSCAGKIHMSQNRQMDAASLSVSVPTFSYDKIHDVWPKNIRNPAVKTWLTERLSAGTLSNVTLDIEAAANGGEGDGKTANGLKVSSVVAEFDLEDMKADYSPPLWPGEGISGHGSFSENKLHIDIEKASVGEVEIKGGTVEISDLTTPLAGQANIALDLEGGIDELLAYIASEPINVTPQDLGLSAEKLDGRADLALSISFPTVKDLKKEAVKVTAEGTLRELFLADIVRDMDLAGKALSFSLTEDDVRLSGEGTLGGEPLWFDWAQALDEEGQEGVSSRVRAKMTTGNAFRKKMGLELDDWISGAVPVEVSYTAFKDRPAVVDVNADLTPGRLYISPFDYTKMPGAKGALSATAILKNGRVSELNALKVQTPSLELMNGRFLFKSSAGTDFPYRGQIERVTLNDTDIALEFEQGSPGAPLKLSAKGAFLDARPFLKGKSGKKDEATFAQPKQAYVVAVDVDRMRTADTRLIENAQAYIEISRAGLLDQLELDARAGQGDLYLRLKPDREGTLTLQLEAGDAGAALRAFDIYDNVKGGTLVIAGKAIDPFRHRLISGEAELRDFKVSNAPALAQLLNLISPAGLARVLSGEGLSFSKLRADFKWQQQAGGDIYYLEDGRTSGASLGLTFEGRIDTQENKMDISGHVVPVSEINKLVGKIPLLGDILAGGKNQAMFAATYKIKGTVDEPEISVNPLSVLTPGIIRKILFED